MMSNAVFDDFFACCVGNWKTERTYHYVLRKEVERSRTEFEINPLTTTQKLKVLQDNSYLLPETVDPLPGFALSFYTISEHGEEVSQSLNLMFVPKGESEGYLEGDYLRDRAYEEAQPIVSYFRFDLQSRELLMKTQYTRIVSVDSITLINPELRIRKIINYQRPPEGQPLNQVVLVGFGVEQKV